MTQKFRFKKLVGQTKVTDALVQAIDNGLLGHAYLFCGPEGVGKFTAAVELALALHCDSKDNAPCYTCDSCEKILHYNDPDFHCVFPLSLESSHKNSADELNEEGWRYVAQKTCERLANPYQIEQDGQRIVPIDWIRELNGSIMRGSTAKRNIAIICDVDLMQQGTANAMLKTLEEPPANTLLILLTKNLHAVLPTIKSRCQILRFGTVGKDELTSALSSACKKAPDDPAVSRVVTCAGGSYGVALSLMDASLDVFFEQAAKLWELCVHDTPADVFTTAIERIIDEQCSGSQDYGAALKLLKAFLQIVRAIFFHNMYPTENYFMGVIKETIPRPAIDVHVAGQLLSACESAISAIQARGNIQLVLITFLLNIVELFHGKKY